MAAIRIRIRGVEEEVDGDAALETLRREGRLGPGTERWTGQEWQPILTPAGAAAHSADPWAAWSEVDENAAEALLGSRVPPAEEEPAELPVAALTPMPHAIVAQPRDAGAPDDLPAAALTPMPEAIVVQPRTDTATLPPRLSRPPPNLAVAPAPDALPPRGVIPLLAVLPAGVPSGPPTRPNVQPVLPAPPVRGLVTPAEQSQLIDFPRRPPRPAPPAPREPEAVPLVRPGRVLAMITAAMFVVGGLWAVEAMSHPALQTVVSVGAKPEPQADPLRTAERELRAAGLGDPRPVRRPPDLGDAVLVELQKLGLSVVAVNAPVTQWTGRKGDDPAAAELHVTFHPSTDVNRDLGAILLVAGRYKLRYNLALSPIEAIAQDESGARAITLDAAKAESFAKGRIGLRAALDL